MFYSAKAAGFYDAALHGNNIPPDAVMITSEQHAALLAGQSQGKRIVADAAGRPFLQDPPPPTSAEIAASVTAARAAAYRDESDPLFFKAQRGEATMQEWLAKVEEIKARYPRPAA
jgi:hypothetical protein